MPAACRVYLFTYKRNHLLKRAIDSLISQTFADWVCELHNDDPADPFPEQYLKQLNDNRLTIKNHAENLGGTKSFNLAFAGCAENYATILEDDNWWEPAFLATMINVMDREPGMAMAWANMKVWREDANGNWIDTKSNIWNDITANQQFTLPHIKQAMGALHSIGAMMYRGNEAANYLIPDNCEQSIIEPVRERLFKRPIYLVNEPLANFSLTINSNRSNQKWMWTACQAMLLSSFIEASANQEQTFKKLLALYRGQKPSPLSNFFIAVVFLLKRPALFKFFTITDWFTINKWLAKNSFNLLKIKRYLNSQQNVYHFLLENTAVQHKSNAPESTICIITQSHLCRNPRVLKEAIALAGAGYQVRILTNSFSAELHQQDLAAIQPYSNIYLQIVSDLSQSTFKSFTDRLTNKLARLLKKRLKTETGLSLGYGASRYFNKAKAIKADLYICHQELAIYIGTKLLKSGYKVGFDLEDWYSEDLLPEARASRPVNLLRQSESIALNKGAYCITTSQAMAKKLSEVYSSPRPGVIYNVFPSLHISTKPKDFSQPLKLFWFSQTIGEGRGIEQFIGLLNNFKTGLELHLLGSVSGIYGEALSKLMSDQHHLYFHELVHADQLPEKIAEFDIGLALELDTPMSRNYTITNKFFQYIQSGLPVIASETAGQKEAFEKYQPGFILSQQPTTHEISGLEKWLNSPIELQAAKAKAIEAAADYNWENESKKLLTIIKKSLEK